MISLTTANVNGTSYGLPQLPFPHKYGPIPVYVNGGTIPYPSFVGNTSTTMHGTSSYIDLFFYQDELIVRFLPSFFDEEWGSPIGVSSLSFVPSPDVYITLIAAYHNSSDCFFDYKDAFGSYAGLYVGSSGSKEMLLATKESFGFGSRRSYLYDRTSFEAHISNSFYYRGVPDTFLGDIRSCQGLNASLNLDNDFPSVSCRNLDQGGTNPVEHSLSTVKAYPWRDYVLSFPYTD